MADGDPNRSRPAPKLAAKGKRIEHDTMGDIAVPADRYWGAQTQRSLHHFAIGSDRMPIALIHAYGRVKRAAAMTNHRLGVLDAKLAEAICIAADDIAAGLLDDHFPLHVWQTGSGTQTNMNVNEVIANRAIQILGGKVGSKTPVHPNDHVNQSQSSNDSFPTAMHVAVLDLLDGRLIPELDDLGKSFRAKARQWTAIPKTGRTHLQDAVPLTLGQEWSGYATQIDKARQSIEQARAGLLEIAQGGTAVGTGLNAPAGFSTLFAEIMTDQIGKPFVSAPDKFEALSSMTALLDAMATVRGAATALLQIANNIRFLASGPRCGIGELQLPANEPGSSIMPGKVNPTQCEAMIQVCTHIIGLDNAAAIAASQGNFQLNTMRPLMIHNLDQAIRTLSDACRSFRQFAIEEVGANKERISELLDRSLMLVTALVPEIGYDRAAQIAYKAAREGTTLREAALALRYLDSERFDALVDPASMTGKGTGGA